MDQLANKVKALIEACAPYAWILAIAGIFFIGVCMAIPSDKTKEFAKSHWLWVIGGTMLASGAVYVGNWIFSIISF